MKAHDIIMLTVFFTAFATFGLTALMPDEVARFRKVTVNGAAYLFAPFFAIATAGPVLIVGRRTESWVLTVITAFATLALFILFYTLMISSKAEK